MTTIKTPADQTLHAISRKHFGGRNYNNEFWFDANSEPTDEGALEGAVYKIEGKGKSKEIGAFKIEFNGHVSVFPSVPKDFIKELNAKFEMLEPLEEGEGEAPKEGKPAVEGATGQGAPEPPNKRRGRSSQKKD